MDGTIYSTTPDSADDDMYRERGRSRRRRSPSPAHRSSKQPKIKVKHATSQTSAMDLAFDRNSNKLANDSAFKKQWTVSYDNQNFIRSQLSSEVMDHLLEKKRKSNLAMNKIWKKDE